MSAPEQEEEPHLQKFPAITEDDEVGPCCTNLDAFKRKIGFWITIGLGAIFYLMAIINLFGELSGDGGGAVIYSTAGTCVAIFAPLWFRSMPQIIAEMREPIRFTTVIVLLIAVVGMFVSTIIWSHNFVVFLFCLVVILAGLWYCLSFYEQGNGQQTVLNFFKSCCVCSKSSNENNNNNTNVDNAATNASSDNSNIPENNATPANVSSNEEAAV